MVSVWGLVNMLSQTIFPEKDPFEGDVILDETHV
jgi:hypothetical protein